MFKLRKYLKPFAFALIIAVLLIFVQSACDLNLPNYMSDIVNTGIQQNGVESGVPSAVSAEGYSFLKLFMNDDDTTLMDSNYTSKLPDDKDSSGHTYVSLYPDMKASVYVLNDDISPETETDIESAVGHALWTMINIMQSDTVKAALAGMNASAGTSESGDFSLTSVNMAELYKLEPMLSMLPEQVFADAGKSADKVDDLLISQSAVKTVSALYDELGVDMSAIQTAYLVKIGGLMLAVALISGIATVAVTYISSKAATGVARNLRNDIFEKVENFSYAEYDKFSTASLITRCTNDVTQIQFVLQMGIRMVFYAPVMAVGGVIMALNKSMSMAWIIAAACIFVTGFMGVIFAVSMPKFKVMQKLIDRVNLIARENLNGLMVIKAFGTKNFELNRFDKANRDLTKNNLFINRVITIMFPTISFIMYALSVTVIWVGAHYVAESTMQIGDMMAFMQYAIQIVMAFLMLSAMFIFIPRASVSADRIAEILETKPTITDPDAPVKMLSDKKGLVEFLNVSFKYDGADDYALRNISFTASPGCTTAFIGSTGSGKSTLLNLIMRFYDVTEGQINVGGVDIRRLTQNDLRSHIGYVPQKSVLMSGTVSSNIAYGINDTDTLTVQNAARTAQAEEFIMGMEEQYDSPISQGGANVSGGQKQRLSIARALAVDPDVYIFDDSFSALDFKTDAALRGALGRYTHDRSVIIVAQRVSTILNADCIYVLDNGAIVGSGTHKELLASCPEYVQIASTQLSEEELTNG